MNINFFTNGLDRWVCTSEGEIVHVCRLKDLTPNLTKKFYVTVNIKLKCVECEEICHPLLAIPFMSFVCKQQFKTSRWIQSM